MTLLLLPSRLAARRPVRSVRPRLVGLDERILLADTLVRADGALGNAETGQAWEFTAGVWTVVSNAAVCTPTLGAELLTDPGVEDWASATDLTSWTEQVAGTSTVNREGADVHGGSYAVRFDVDASNSNTAIYQNPVVAAGTWIQVSLWGKSSPTGKTLLYSDGLTSWVFPALGASYAQQLQTFRLTSANLAIFRRSAGTSASLYLDDASLTPLPLADLFATIDGGAADVLAEAEVSVVAGTQAGLVLRLDGQASPGSCLLAYHNGTNAILDSAPGLTYTTQISTAATYGQWRKLAVELRGEWVRLFYHGAQIGAWKQLSDSRLLGGTRFGFFSTYSGNSIRNLTVRRLGQAA